MGAREHIAKLVDDAVGVVFPSAQLVVVNEGREWLSHASGAADATTLFDLASLTKPLCTAALVVQRIADKKISLSDRPRPEHTIEQLLTHAGGLPAVVPLADPTHPSEATRRAAVEHARTIELSYAPGSKSIYSDLGFIVLGDVLEQLGPRLDVAFATIARGRSISFGPVLHAAPAEGRRGEVHDDNARAMLGVAGHAGLFGNASAVSSLVAEWVDAWHGDATVFEPALVRRAFAPSTIPGSTWGLGWDHPSLEHSSAGTRWPRTGTGHLGFTGCSIWIDPPHRRWVVLVTNRVEPTRANEEIRRFRPLLHDAVMQCF